MNDITLSQLYDNASNCIGSFNFDTNIARNFTKKNSGIKKTYASAYIGLSPYKTQDLISQLAILDRGGGGVSGCFNIVPLPSPRRITLNSEQRHCGTRWLPICYNYRNCHSLSLLSGINC